MQYGVWVTKVAKEDITNKWEGYKRKREERERGFYSQ